MNAASALARPEPIAADAEVLRIDGNARYREVEEQLTRGQRLCLTDTWGTALTLYGWLKKQVRRRCPSRDYAGHRRFREVLHQLGQHLLVPVEGHGIALRKAPASPFLQRLYPETGQFLLPLPEILGLNGAWQWYERGVRYPFLEHPIHPFYGVYFSPRHEHLTLFAEWLSAREPPHRAADVGTGCGVLAFLLLQRGCTRVHATDTSANAALSAREDAARLGLAERLAIEQADLLGSFAGEADLIAFNPPWLPGEPRTLLDQGSHYPEDLFPRFFAAAAARLSPQGRLVLLFSNFAQVAGLAESNPIERELQDSDRFRLVARREEPASPSGRQEWQKHLRQSERLQLWELAPKG